MPTIPRLPLRLHPALAFLVMATCLATITWLVSFSPWKVIPFSVVGQAYAMVALLLAFRYWPPMIHLVRRMPVPHRIVFGAMIASIIAGHYTINSHRYFPFVAWEIFAFVREDNPVTCREFIATTAAGSKVRLLVEQLFPSIVQINALDTYPPDTTEHLARTLAKAYNGQHPADPVREVDLVVMAVALHPPAQEMRAQPSCELLQRYDISSVR